MPNVANLAVYTTHVHISQLADMKSPTIAYKNLFTFIPPIPPGPTFYMLHSPVAKRGKKHIHIPYFSTPTPTKHRMVWYVNRLQRTYTIVYQRPDIDRIINTISLNSNITFCIFYINNNYLFFKSFKLFYKCKLFLI